MGQTDEMIKFISRGGGFDLSLGANETVYYVPDRRCKQRDKEDKKSAPCRMLSLKMKMSGTNEDAAIHGVGEMVAKSAYYIGNDPTKWLDNISHFKAVRYEQIYNGIDLVFRGSEQNLEYDFHVAPAADPKLIQLEFEGAKNIRIDRKGDLVFRFNGVELRHQKPLAYQMVDGIRREISLNYILLGKNRVGFQVGEYDKSKELVIDPVIYASYLGGTTGGDSVNDIAVGRDGYVLPLPTSGSRFRVRLSAM